VVSRARSDRAPALPTGEDKVRAVRRMFDSIAPRYEAMNDIMTFGLDRLWRRTCVAALELAPGALVLDVACGTGDMCRLLHRAGHRPVGLDMSRGMLSVARTGAPLVQADALAMPFVGQRFDGVVSAFALRNVVDLSALFADLARVVRPGGRLSLLDLAEPPNALLRLGHRLWAGTVVPRLGALLSDAGSYRYLPRSLAYLPSGPVMSQLLGAAGFQAVQRRLLSGGVTQLYTATRSGAAP
jgi:demethylmenaquinone methyltransferase/2-methoxy-6-polyprenyl-1,4-benzoquinol methylase